MACLLPDWFKSPPRPPPCTGRCKYFSPYHEAQKRLQSQRRDLERYMHDATALGRQKSELRRITDAQHNEIQDLKIDIDALSDQFRECQKVEDSQRGEILDLRRERDSLRVQATELRNEKETILDEFESLREENKSLHAAAKQQQESESVQKRMLADTQQANDHLHRELERLKKEQLAENQKINQLQGLLAQASKEAQDNERRHREEVDELIARINVLQIGREALTDEQLIDQLRKLGQHLDSWVKSNFKDTQQLATMTRSSQVEFPRSSHQRRAWIQASLTDLICDNIFWPYHFGAPAKCSKVLQEVENGVERTCSATTWHHWRIGTNATLDHFLKGSRHAIFMEIISYIDDQFARYSSTEPERRTTQLHDLLQRCSDFKSRICKQQDGYKFRRHPPGAEFDSGSMTFAGGDGEARSKVRLALWPSLLKFSSDTGYQVLEPELVWTMAQENAGSNGQGEAML